MLMVLLCATATPHGELFDQTVAFLRGARNRQARACAEFLTAQKSYDHEFSVSIQRCGSPFLSSLLLSLSPLPSVCLFLSAVCLPICLSARLSVCTSVCLCVRLSVSVYLSVSMFLFHSVASNSGYSYFILLCLQICKREREKGKKLYPCVIKYYHGRFSLFPPPPPPLPHPSPHFRRQC